MKHFDVCVIGAGPSGFAAAMRAIDLGKSVAIIERGNIGGAGIYNGALSSKTLWELSQKYQITQDTNAGYTIFDSEVSFTSVMREVNKAVHCRHAQLKAQLDYFIRRDKITYIKGSAHLLSETQIEISAPDHSISTISAEKIVLAVGSRPRYLADIPIDEKTIVTSDGISSFQDFPESIVILGAGVIGCEFATIFSNFGQTKVYLIDKAPRILPFEDEDISRRVAQNLEQNGVHIHRGAALKCMQIVNNKVEYTLCFDDGHEETRTVEKALVSVGRVPNIEQLGLDKIGLELSPRGHALDSDTQTSISNIYAVGDFTADIALVNIAELEGRHAIEKMFNLSDHPLQYSNISTIMFLNPEVGSVGMNEIEARKKGISYKMACLSYQYISRAIAMCDTNGYIKLLVSNDDEMRVLGLRVIGNHASSTLEALALMIQLKISVKELAELIHPHPSITEGIQECARMLLGKSIIKPDVFNKDLKCYSVSKDGRIEDLRFNLVEI
tara:strand:+ start:1769 stop:3265 length:1497 start_codon:yes stop_codon:yes gene_type:complete